MNLTPLNQLELVAITGLDAEKLTQGQLTCDMTHVESSKAALGALCNREGRVLNVFYVFKTEAGFCFLLPKSSTETFIQTLKKYAVFYKVDIALLTDTHLYLDTTAQDGIALPEIAASLVLSKTAYTEDASNDIWRQRCVTYAVPQIYAETSGLFLPQELNLTTLKAVNFQKGCYTGQEIIARMHYRGQSAKAMFLASAETSEPLKPGQEIYSDNRAVGLLIDAARIDTGYTQVLVTYSPQKVTSNCIYLDPQERTRLDLLSLPYQLG